MHTRLSLIRVVVAVGLWLASSAGAPAQAQQDDFKGAPEGYRELLVQALQQVERSRWPEAMALFEQAHALYPNARTLRGLAIVSFESRRYADTLGYAKGALDSAVRPLTDKQKKHLQGLLAQARTFVGRYALSLSPAEVELFVNGQPARLDEGQLVLDPGQYELVARATGHADVVRQLSVRAGQQGELSLRLQPNEVAAAQPDEAPQAAGEPSVEARVLPAQPQAEEPGRRRRVWTWIAAGTSVAAAAGAIGAFVSAGAERDDIAAACAREPAGGCTRQERDQRVQDSGIGTKETVTTALLVTSLTTAAAAAVLFWVEGRAPRERAGDGGEVRVGVSPFGLSVAGRF